MLMITNKGGKLLLREIFLLLLLPLCAFGRLEPIPDTLMIAQRLLMADSASRLLPSLRKDQETELALNLKWTLASSRQLRYDNGVGLAHMAFGYYYFRRATPDFDSAAIHYTQAIPYLKDNGKLVEVYSNLAGVYFYLNRIIDSKRNSLLAVKLAEKAGDKINRAKAYQLMGMLKESEGNHREGLANLRKADSLYKIGAAPQQRIRTLNYLGWIQMQGLHNPEAAIPLLHESISIIDSIGGDAFKHQAETETLLARAFLKTRNLDSATARIAKAKAHLHHSFYPEFELSEALTVEGEIYLAQHRYKMAEAALLDAFAHVPKPHDGGGDVELEICEQLGELYGVTRQYDKALSWKNKYLALFKTNFESQQKHVEDLQAYYETERKKAENENLRNESELKDKRIKLQQIGMFSVLALSLSAVTVILALRHSRKRIERKNLELEKTNEKLHDLISLRERLLSVLAHDIRGPLFNINSLAYIKTLTTSKEELERLETIISNSVTATLNLLDNILLWSSSKQSEDDLVMTRVSIVQLLDDIQKTYKAMAEQKGLQLIVDISQVDGCDLIETDLSILHLVLRNLVNNAIKFTASGTVIMGCKHEADNAVTFEVIDTGLGIPAEKLPSILGGKIAGKKSLGTKDEVGSSLGLMLGQSFLTKLHSQLHYRRNSNSTGSIFYFTLPRTPSRLIDLKAS